MRLATLTFIQFPYCRPAGQLDDICPSSRCSGIDRHAIDAYVFQQTLEMFCGPA